MTIPMLSSDDCPDCGDPFCMGCDFNVKPEDDEANWASTSEISQMADYDAMRGNSQQMSEAEITAQMAEEAKPENNLFFGDDVSASMDRVDEGSNLCGDPIARGLTSEEEDAEVGRLWAIDASRLSDGE